MVGALGLMQWVRIPNNFVLGMWATAAPVQFVGNNYEICGPCRLEFRGRGAGRFGSRNFRPEVPQAKDFGLRAGMCRSRVEDITLNPKP